MTNFIASIILLLIAVFVITLFPGGKEFIADVTSTFTEKRNNIAEEYERVKGGVDSVTETVKETKDKVDGTVEAIGSAVDKASEAVNKVNDLVNGDKEDEETDEEINDPAA